MRPVSVRLVSVTNRSTEVKRPPPQNLREGTAHDSGVLDKGADVTKYNSKCNKILHCKHL